MSAISGAVDWAGRHPVTTAVGVFALGALLLIVFKGGGSGGGGGADAAFYQAQAAQAAINAQLVTTQSNNATAAHIADTAASQNIQIATVQAQTDTTLAQINADVTNQQTAAWLSTQKFANINAVGQNALQGQALPYLLSGINQGNPLSLKAFEDFVTGATSYHAPS